MPALLAIPAILAAISAGIMAILKYLLEKFGRKVLFGTAFIIAYTAILVTFVSSLNNQFSDLLVSLPNNSFSLAGLSLVPENAITCATIVVTAKASQMAFYFAIGIIKVKLKA